MGYVVSVLLILFNAFFVAAEYALIGANPNRIDSLVKKGNKSAKLVQAAQNKRSWWIAGLQIAITMCGIGIGSITEPLVTEQIGRFLGPFSLVLSLIIVTYVLVLFGELVPKYAAYDRPERLAMLSIRPLKAILLLGTPLIWFVEKSGATILRLLNGNKASAISEDALSKDELLLMLRAGVSDGALDREHGQVVTRALRFDVLDAADIMIHRLDIKWIPIDTGPDELLQKVGATGHSRVPVCRDHIDDVVGILYVQDLMKSFAAGPIDLEKVIRPVEVVPETLSLTKLVERMREAKSQILLVTDEYGGTSGLVTLEDIVEEIFGDLEDQIETERPPIERVSSLRISARADVRYDELVEFLGLEATDETSTESIATIVSERLERVPKLGDQVADELGLFRVENMARRRITRIGLQLSDAARAPSVETE